jgi:hypothetical protein
MFWKLFETFMRALMWHLARQIASDLTADAERRTRTPRSWREMGPEEIADLVDASPAERNAIMAGELVGRRQRKLRRR